MRVRLSYIHDVAGNNRLVVLPPREFTQVQEVTDDSDQKPVLLQTTMFRLGGRQDNDSQNKIIDPQPLYSASWHRTGTDLPVCIHPAPFSVIHSDHGRYSFIHF